MNNESFVHAWHNHTTLHPLGLLAMILLGAAMFLLPRRHAALPLLVMACFVSPAQRFVVMSLDFNLIRVLVLFGALRVWTMGELVGVRWRRLDTAVIAWAVVGAGAYAVQQQTVGAAINRAGFLFDVLGVYGLCRVLIRDVDDVLALSRGVALLAIPVVACFIIESRTGRNMFSIFGGVPEFTQLRQGRLRCQGAFSHPILAGCFWAALLPLPAFLLFRPGLDRILGVTGAAAAVVIILVCRSTTPVAAVALGGVAALCFPFRNGLSLIRWGAATTLLTLHVVMVQPVWHLLARLDITGGSTGWYRYLLIDEFIRRLPEWALVGTRSTDGWWTWGMADVTNQYVMEGVRGGLPTLLLFLSVIALAFAGAGRVRRDGERAARPRSRADRDRAMIGWAVGVALFIQCCAFIAVSYFGQAVIIWYLNLAVIASLAGGWRPARRPAPRAARAARPGAHAPRPFPGLAPSST